MNQTQLPNDLPLVSIVVPVYNPGEYFLSCLHSLAAQDWPRLEIILVDDGSTDKSADTAEAFAAQDGRFRLVRQANSGAAQARANGLALAEGAFVILMDSDDLTHPGMVSALTRAALAHNADLAFCRFAPFTGEAPSDGPVPSDAQTLSGKQAREMLLHDQRLDYALSNKLFRRGVLTPEMLRCPYRWNEDLLAAWRAFQGVETAVFLNFDGYHCRQHAGSVSHQGISRVFLADQWAVAKIILADSAQTELSDSANAFYDEKLLYLCSMILRQRVPGDAAALLSPLKKELKSRWHTSRTNPALSFRLRLVGALTLWGGSAWGLVCRVMLRDKR